MLLTWLGGRPAACVVAELVGHGIACELVMMPHELDAIPQLRAQELFEDVNHQIVGHEVVVGYPVRFEGGPHRFHRSASPLLGSANQDVLANLLGKSAAELERLEQTGVIGSRPRRQ
jgi:crotonobetainyl-CoA:carnitine CoA-transferase CaiB-like acyl-CoA transferase